METTPPNGQIACKEAEEMRGSVIPDLSSASLKVISATNTKKKIWTAVLGH
jgi:hypothetical protein